MGSGKINDFPVFSEDIYQGPRMIISWKIVTNDD